MPLRKGLNRQPADWVSYKDKVTGKVSNEFVTKGKEKEYYEQWKLLDKFKKNPAMLQLIEKNLDQMTDWNATKRFSGKDDMMMNHIDFLRMRDMPNEEIIRNIGPMELELKELMAAGIPGNIAMDFAGSGMTPDQVKQRLENDQLKMREAEEDWEYENSPIGTGTGVDPARTKGEWQNGVLEIPSEEGGLGLRIDLNNQPWMNKKKKKI